MHQDDQKTKFLPVAKNVLRVHWMAISILSVLVVLLFYLATQVELGLLFLMSLFGALFLAVPIPVIFSRLKSFREGSYTIGREGIILKWGNRVEEIPISDVQWVREVEDLTIPLTLPRPRWRGAIVGSTRHPDAGIVEFMASDEKQLVLVGTGKKVFVISPENKKEFISTYLRKTEMGSISALKPYSVYPSFLFSTIWRSRSSKIFLVVSIVLALGLFLWVGLTVPNKEDIFLGFNSLGIPLGPIPANQLYLIPSLNILLQAGAFFLSSYYHRKEPDHPMTYILWFSSTAMSVLFFVAIYLGLGYS